LFKIKDGFKTSEFWAAAMYGSVQIVPGLRDIVPENIVLPLCTYIGGRIALKLVQVLKSKIE